MKKGNHHHKLYYIVRHVSTNNEACEIMHVANRTCNKIVLDRWYQENSSNMSRTNQAPESSMKVGLSSFLVTGVSRPFASRRFVSFRGFSSFRGNGFMLYIYIYIKRERERERDVYIYIYIHIHTHILILVLSRSLVVSCRGGSLFASPE